MYLGTHEVKFNIYIDKTIASGVRYAMLHHYRCEHCGHEHNVKFRAEEPFFCGGQCQRLVGIEPATAESAA